MYRNRIQDLTSSASTSGAYGSRVPAQFLSDAINGTNSVDIVVWGDSNAGSSASCGYTAAWSDVLSGLGAQLYATPLCVSGSEDGTNNRQSGLFTPFVYSNWMGRSAAGSTGTVYSLSNRVAAADADAVELNNTFNGLYVHEGTATASSSTSLTLAAGASAVNSAYVGMSLNILTGTLQQAFVTAYNGTTKVATVASWSDGTPSATASYSISKANIKPFAFTYAPSFVAAGGTYTSAANGASVRLSPAHPFVLGVGTAGVNLQYRVVYGTFTTSGGTFKLRAMTGTNTLISGATQTPSTISTSGGSGYATATMDFTTITSASVALEVKCAWDGWNSSSPANNATGPCAILWQSIIRKSTLGYSVNCLNYRGGWTTAQLASSLSQFTKYLESYLKELRQRQIAAGGTGRVIWWHNSGINGNDTSASWISGVESIRDTVYTTWTGLGFPGSDLAFIMSPTHPTVTGDSGDGGWAVARASAMPAINSWGQTSYNANRNVCVVDIAELITAAQLRSKNLYQVTSNNIYAAHLREGPNAVATWLPSASGAPQFGTTYSGDAMTVNNGYIVVMNAIVRKLLSVA